MAVTVFRRRSNLSKMVDASGGMTVLAALRGAELETASVRDEGRAILMEAIGALEEAAARPLAAEAWLDAAQIIDVCPAELPALYRAAYSLCDLSDQQRRVGRVDRPPIDVHVAALRPLSQPGQDLLTAAPVLTGLEALLARETAKTRLPDAG